MQPPVARDKPRTETPRETAPPQARSASPSRFVPGNQVPAADMKSAAAVWSPAPGRSSRGLPRAALPAGLFTYSRADCLRSPNEQRLNRSKRVLLVLVAVFLLNGFDLFFTLDQAQAAHFVELNPIAAQLLENPQALILYKFALLGIGSAIIIWFRRHSVAEWAAWFLLAACIYVGLRWHSYYEALMRMPAESPVS